MWRFYPTNNNMPPRAYTARYTIHYGFFFNSVFVPWDHAQGYYFSTIYIVLLV